MVDGRVITGYSKPYVAKYNHNGTTVTYSDCMPLARGVDVNINVNGAVGEIFYANNQAAESGDIAFIDGTLTNTIDGMLNPARNLIMGVAAGEDWTDYDDDQTLPYVGYGFVMRVMSDSVTTYVPIIFPKTKFNPENESAATQEKGMKFQTSTLTAQIFRDDTAKHCWKKIGKDYTAEAEAVAAIVAFFS